MKKLVRTTQTDCKLFGVCGGIAKYFGIDSTLIRIAMILLTIGYGIGALLYVVVSLIAPSETN